VAYYSGTDGEMKIDQVVVARVTSFSFTSNQETLDVTTLGDKDRKLIGGLRSLSGSASIAYYSAGSATDKRAQYLIGKLMKTEAAASETVSLELGINVGTTYRRIEFTAVITSIAMSSAQGEIFSADVSFEADGGLISNNLE
tara:strand:+ start:4839 stop:5264 length:426 start_codon:yes stop_codon:yes gene_type:complete